MAEVVLQHHERLDGSGYPAGLAGEDILIESRILAVSDVVEAMSSRRPYRERYGIGIALEDIKGKEGRSFDQSVSEACLELFEKRGFSF